MPLPSGRWAQISPSVNQRRWPIPARAEEAEPASSLGEGTDRRAELASRRRKWGCQTSLADSLRYVGPATGLSLPLSGHLQEREAFKLRGQSRGQTAPQNGPSLGVTDSPDQRALHEGARKQDHLIFKSLNHSRQRPQSLFDPSYFPLDEKRRARTSVPIQIGRLPGCPRSQQQLGRHPGALECLPLGNVRSRDRYQFVSPWNSALTPHSKREDTSSQRPQIPVIDKCQ